MAMAATVLAAASPPPLTSWRRKPLLAAHPRANPSPALRLRAVGSSLRTGPIPRNSCAGAAAAGTPCAAAVSGGVEAEVTGREAPGWDVLKRAAVLFALGCCACAGAAALGCGAARAAAEDSIRASGFGLRVAASLRRLGWPDDAVVFALAMLPVIELRGAIPVGYWMRLHPVRLTVLSILGNMVPVPFIILYLKKQPPKPRAQQPLLLQKLPRPLLPSLRSPPLAVASAPMAPSLLAAASPFLLHGGAAGGSSCRPPAAAPARRAVLRVAALKYDPSKVAPQSDRVLVLLQQIPEKSAGGILLPKSSVKFERYLMGEILSVGSDVSEVEAGKKDRPSAGSSHTGWGLGKGL